MVLGKSPSGAEPFRTAGQTPTTILVAEDPFINTFLRTVLQRRGHKVVTSDPAQGSDLMRTGEVKADLVITNKPEAFLPFAEQLPILYIAATPDPARVECFHACRMLRKPFRSEDLLEAVEELSRAL
jgi:CheY-like chemotaxis protein